MTRFLLDLEHFHGPQAPHPHQWAPQGRDGQLGLEIFPSPQPSLRGESIDGTESLVTDGEIC
jgi:hypothetical protein